MKSIEKLEVMVARWLESLPHLPTSARKWISDNIWWVMLIGACLMTLVVVNIADEIFTALSLMDTPWGYNVKPIYDAAIVVNLLVLLSFTLAAIILMAMAIKPLRLSEKRGWKLLFCTLILWSVAAVAGAVLTFNVMALVWAMVSSIVGTIIGAYLLYEIRSYFNISVKSKTSPKK